MNKPSRYPRDLGLSLRMGATMLLLAALVGAFLTALVVVGVSLVAVVVIAVAIVGVASSAMSNGGSMSLRPSRILLP